MTTTNLLESLLWPRTLIGWVIFVLLAMGGCLLLSEVYSSSVNYMKTYDWNDAPATLISIELDTNKVAHLRYKYTIDGVEFFGDRIGIDKRKWHNLNSREIYNFEYIKANSKQITIKYNPKDKNDSVYQFNSNDIFIILSLGLSVLLMAMIYLYVLVIKIMRGLSQL